MNRASLNLLAFLLLSFVLQACKGDDGGAVTPPGPQWVTFTAQNSPLLSNRVSTIYVDGEGRVWIGTDQGASAFYRGSWSAIVDSLAFPVFSSSGTTISHQVAVITGGRDGSVWFGLEGGGVRRYIRGGGASQPWHRYESPTIPSDFVSSIGAVRDKAPGDVWVGGVGQGVTRFVPQATNPELGVWYPSSTFNPNLPSTNVYVISVNPLTYQPVFGTQNGIALYDDENNIWVSYIIPATYRSPIITLAFDLSNTIWMGKWSGVSTYNRSTSDAVHYTNANTGGKLPPGFIHAIETDLHSTRWFGTDFGLARLEDTTWTTFTHALVPDLPSDTIKTLMYDRAGNIWIGTPAGVAVYNQKGTRF